MKMAFAGLLVLITVGWAVFLVLLSVGVVVDNPPEFSEAGVGTLLGYLMTKSGDAIKYVFSNK